MKKICFVSADTGGCAWYRSYLPAKYLGRDHVGFQPTFSPGFIPAQVNYYLEQDVVILQRHNHPDLLKFVDRMHKNGKQVWYDLDDLLWEIPSSNNARTYWKKDNVANMNNLIKACDKVTTSTEPLAQYLKRFNKNVYVIPNRVEDNFIEKKDNDKVRVLWAGSDTHAGDFTSDVKHALKYILENHDIELYFVGYIPPEFNTDKFGDKVKYVEGVTVEKYIGTLQLLNPDISIMPLVDNYFNTCKSNLKFLESTLAGAVSIGSKVYPYENTIQHGTTGLLVGKKAKEWISALELFINDKQYRDTVYANAKAQVQEGFCWSTDGILSNFEQYKELTNGIE